MNPLSTRKRVLLFGVWSLVVVSVGCGSNASPTSPTSASQSTYTVSGIVSASTPAGLTPVAGAEVGLETSAGVQRTTSDSNGRYTFVGATRGNATIHVSKDGHQESARRFSIDRDIQLNIQLVDSRTYTLSGVVFEIVANEPSPLAEVEVYCDSCGEFGHTFAYTNTNGLYSFSGVRNGGTFLLVRKGGYRLVGATSTFPQGSEGISASVTGDTRFDIQLVRP